MGEAGAVGDKESKMRVPNCAVSSSLMQSEFSKSKRRVCKLPSSAHTCTRPWFDKKKNNRPSGNPMHFGLSNIVGLNRSEILD